MSAQHDRRTARALVCGALLVYGCLRIPAAAESPRLQSAELQERTEAVRQLEASPEPRLSGLALAGLAESGG